jgi:hypothetical protein
VPLGSFAHDGNRARPNATQLLDPGDEWFHEHPEVANQERETAARLSSVLQGFGFTEHAGIGGTGLVATLEGQKPGKGPSVSYRADMDGLPVTLPTFRTNAIATERRQSPTSRVGGTRALLGGIPRCGHRERS